MVGHRKGMGEILACLKAPKGQKRPADVIGNAVRVMEIATGQREEEIDTRDELQAALSKIAVARN
jgi:hypothetical protein